MRAWRRTMVPNSITGPAWGGATVRVYTLWEAQQDLASVLDAAERVGGVAIRRPDGSTFVVQPSSVPASPLDVVGVDLELDRAEIVDFVREARTPRAGEGHRRDG